MWRKSLWLLRSLPFEPMALTTLDSLTQKLQQMKNKQNDVLASKMHKRILNLLLSSSVHSNNKLPQNNSVITSALVQALLPLACKWFDSGKLFFISPKHDGVRLISYVPTTQKQSKDMLCHATESNSITTCHNKLAQTSCYTRYGRPLYGVFWLEPQLCLLRHVCGDLHLVLDGELYIHRSPGKQEKTQEESNRTKHIKNNITNITTNNANINSCNGDMTACNTNNKRQVKSQTERCHESQSKSSGKCSDVFKTGFLAVSSLVHRLRGSSTHVLRTKDMLQYVSTLPSYCVFDVASYNPPISFINQLKVKKKQKNYNNKNNNYTSSSSSSSSKCKQVNNINNNIKHKGIKHNMKVIISDKQSQNQQPHWGQSLDLPSYVSKQIEKIWHYTLAACKVNNVEQLRVIPNVTPFSSRLRTLHFLFTLLAKAYANNILYEHFIANQQNQHQQQQNSQSMCINGTKHEKCNRCSKTLRQEKQHNLRQQCTLIKCVASNNNHNNFVNAHSHTTRQKSKKKDVTSKDRRYREMYMKRIPYHVVHSLHQAQNVFLPQFLNDGYEGAVIRSPMNVYEIKQKDKNTVAGLVLSKRSASRSDLFALPLASSHQSISAASTQRTRQSQRNHNRKKVKLIQGKQCSKDKDKVINNNETFNRKQCNSLLCQAAIQLSRCLPPRSHSVVKLLAFKDTQYAVLRPLLKLPSTNPRSRPLIEIPLKQLGKTSQSHNIKQNTHDRRALMKKQQASQAYATSTTIQRNQSSVDDNINVDKQKKKKKSGSVNSITSQKSIDASNSVAFYGLQCVAENGRVFNVSLPKMSAGQQQLLLDHLLQTSKRKRSAANSKNKNVNTNVTTGNDNNNNINNKVYTMTASAAQTLPLTGLYVTVKYSTLTQHGIPRFASVKAIRGGKGWFM